MGRGWWKRESQGKQFFFSFNTELYILVKWVDEGTHSVIKSKDLVECSVPLLLEQGDVVGVRCGTSTYQAEVLEKGMLCFALPNHACMQV